MPASTIIKHLEDGSLTLRDGAGHSLLVPFDMGDVKVTGLSADQVERKEYQTRGRFRSLRKGADTHPEFSFSFSIADYADATNQTVVDFLRKTGSYAGNTSTLSGSDVYCIDAILTVAGVALGDPSNHTITCEDLSPDLDLEEGEPNKGSVSGTVYGATTIT